MNLFGRGGKAPQNAAERQQKAQQREARMALLREARNSTRAMQPPEPRRGLYVSAFLVAVGLLSYLSTDVATLTKTVDHKTVSYTTNVQHPATAVVLVALAALAAGSIYWKRRLVTGIAFMLCAAIGVGTPLPKSASDLVWVTFLVPAAYVLWMLIFRMNREQKDWMAKHNAASSSSSRPARSAAPKRPEPAARGRRAKKEPVATTPSGRRLPARNRRYTPPRPRADANDRKG